MTPKSKALANALADQTEAQQRQAEFVAVYLDGLRETLLKMVYERKLPPEWDGHEIRLLLSDRCSRNVSSTMLDRRSKRVRDYETHCLTYNLY